jgi:hypothetical protein
MAFGLIMTGMLYIPKTAMAILVRFTEMFAGYSWNQYDSDDLTLKRTTKMISVDKWRFSCFSHS